MSATTMPGHQPRCWRHQCRLGHYKPPGLTLPGVTQLTNSSSVTESCSAESVAATTGVFARTEVGNEVIGHVSIKPLEQCLRADLRQRRQSRGRARTLTEAPAADTPLVSA
jgi:hypothetical protein